MDAPDSSGHEQDVDERRRARIMAKCGPMKIGIVEPKVNCKFCGVSFLAITAKRTGGFCLPHIRMGMPFIKRIGTTIVRGEPSDLETARREFQSKIPGEARTLHGHLLQWHWQRFEDVFKPGDTIRRFTSYPSDLRCYVYAKNGFICERDGEIIEGVITVPARSAFSEMEDRAFLAACASSKELADDILALPFEEDFDARWEVLMH